jgi:aminoglycoside phosphotransferase (APT) family kinase protein
MAWTYFDDFSRKIFRESLNFDESTWNRARGWALWKALITFNGNRFENPDAAAVALAIIEIILADTN